MAKHLTTGLLVILFAGSLSGCKEQDPYAIQWETFHNGERGTTDHVSCVLLQSDIPDGPRVVGCSTTQSVDDDDYFQQDCWQDEVLTITFSSQGRELARREYDTEFLRSRTIDSVAFTTAGGDDWYFRYQGAQDCEDLPATLE